MSGVCVENPLDNYMKEGYNKMEQAKVFQNTPENDRVFLRTFCGVKISLAEVMTSGSFGILGTTQG